MVIIHLLISYQEDEGVRRALWDIILGNNNKQMKDYDLVAISCLQSLYCGREIDLNEEELNQLDLLRKSSLSSYELQQAALTGSYMHIIKQPRYYCVFEVYCSYMKNIGDENNDIFNDQQRDKIVEKASDWIISHRSVLLTRFVEELCKCLKPFHKDFYSYICVADLLCGKIREEFCDTIRQSVVGEDRFKDYLCAACRTNLTDNNGHIIHCVQVYACFQEFTCDYASMLLKVTDDDLSRRLSSTIQLLTIDRDAIDYLFDIVNSISSSNYERFRAAQVLFNLTKYDYVSIVEIQEAIVSAIEKFGLEDDQSDCDLKWLLAQNILDDLSDLERFPKTFQRPVASLTATPCLAAPAIVFLDS
jgi:hypothetical protein